MKDLKTTIIIKLKRIFLIFLSSFITATVFPQQMGFFVSPGIVYPGQQTHLHATFDKSIFTEKIESLNIEEIDITNFHIISANEILLNISVENNPIIGNKQLQIQLESQILTFSNFVEIVPVDMGMQIFIQPLPVQKIYFSDIDPFDMKNAAELFEVQIFNSSTNQDLTIEFIIYNEKYGLVRKGTKDYKNVQPNQQLNIKYTEFENYYSTEISDAVLNFSKKTGYLPFGNYLYTINVYDKDGYLLLSEQEENFLNNSFTNIELSGPGNPLDMNPEVIYTRFPQFQWFANAFNYSLTIYEVLDYQKTPDEILTNFPVHVSKNLNNSTFIYPSFAELLETGKTYAWQLTAEYQGSHGKEKQFSDVYWFQIADKAQDVLHDKIENIFILPELTEVSINSQKQFKAFAITVKNDTIPINCDWRTVPSNYAIIDAKGNLKTGSTVSYIAVVAEYRDLKTYITVRIKEDE
jgi:hypothetical protein